MQLLAADIEYGVDHHGHRSLQQSMRQLVGLAQDRLDSAAAGSGGIEVDDPHAARRHGLFTP